MYPDSLNPEVNLMNCHHIKSSIFTAMFGGVFCLSAPAVSQVIQLAAADKEPDYTSQQAWQGGMQSGEGNFMANCVACHGPQGKGDGVLVDSLDVKPRDLTNKSIIASRTDEYLFKVIKHGGVSVGLSDSMPLWGTTFSDVEIKNIIKHIRTGICKCEYSGKK
jgi:mono/diheme cytochrome c family protein